MVVHITITGTLGSGKSTVAKELAQRLGITYYSAGSVFRQVAEERGISILDVNKLAKTDPTIDERADAILISLNKSETPYVIDSRLAWHFVAGSFKVRLEVSKDVAVARVCNDETRSLTEEYASAADAFDALLDRRKEEVERWKHMYGVDIEDNSNFDLVIDTSYLNVNEVCDKIVEAYDELDKNKEKM